jgi:predicted HTH domain antitoxin
MSLPFAGVARFPIEVDGCVCVQRQHFKFMNASVTLELPADLLSSARMTLEELRLELAVHLFEQKRLSLGKAAQLAGLTKWDFVPVLGAREISVFGDAEQALADEAMLAVMAK